MSYATWADGQRIEETARGALVGAGRSLIPELVNAPGQAVIDAALYEVLAAGSVSGDLFVVTEAPYLAVGDGVTDSTVGLLAAFAAAGAYAALHGGASLYIPAGTFLTSTKLPQLSGVVVFAAGELISTIKATSTATFALCPSVVQAATGATNVGMFNLTVDANGPARVAAGALTTSNYAECVRWDATGFIADRVTVTNAIGSLSGGSVGFVMLGSGGRVGTISCTSCGTAARASDGVYCGASDTYIRAVLGTACTDTLAVLEQGNRTHIDLVKATSCHSIAAMSCFGGGAATQLTMGTVIADGWDAAVSGAIQIDALGAGGLTKCGIGKVALSGTGVGPAINFRKLSSGNIDVFDLPDVTIDGTFDLQGVVGVVKNLRGGTWRIKGSQDTSVHFLTGGSDNHIEYLDLAPGTGALFGFASDGNNNCTVGSLKVATQATLNWNAYFENTATGCGIGPGRLDVNATNVGSIGSDAGTTPQVLVFVSDNTLRRTKALLPVFDANGAIYGSAHVDTKVTTAFATTWPIDCTLGGVQEFTGSTASTGFAVSAPTNGLSGQLLTLTIKNTSGGALGTATFNAVFKMATWTQPATGFSRAITFRYDGTNWVEKSRTAADVPN